MLTSKRALVSNISFVIIIHFNIEIVNIGNNITFGKSNAYLCDTIRPKYRWIVIVIKVAFVTLQEMEMHFRCCCFIFLLSIRYHSLHKDP